MANDLAPGSSSPRGLLSLLAFASLSGCSCGLEVVEDCGGRLCARGQDGGALDGGGPRVCGDGVLDPGERCDDGNLSDLDDCSFGCQRARYVCPPEEAAGLADAGTLRIPESTDFVALCNGQVLLANRAANQLDLFDAPRGVTLRSYALPGKPARAALDADDSTAYVIFDTVATLAKVDLVLGTVEAITIRAPGVELAVSPGTVFVSHHTVSPSFEAAIAAVDTTAGTLRLTFTGSAYQPLLAFDPSRGRLFSATAGPSPATLTSFAWDLSAVTLGQLEQRGSVGANCRSLRISPDQQHIALSCEGGNGPGYILTDFSPARLMRKGGEWQVGPNPTDAAFSLDSMNLVASNGEALLVFDVATHALQRSFPAIKLPNCVYVDIDRVGFSRGGRFVFGLGRCDSHPQLTWALVP